MYGSSGEGEKKAAGYMKAMNTQFAHKQTNMKEYVRKRQPQSSVKLLLVASVNITQSAAGDLVANQAYSMVLL